MLEINNLHVSVGAGSQLPAAVEARARSSTTPSHSRNMLPSASTAVCSPS
jgi:hypothetical protein